MFKYYNHLGHFNPYFIMDHTGEMRIEHDFARILNYFKSPLKIDPVAILEVLNKNYMLGDRTIIRNVNRTPWMAKPEEKNRRWNFYNIPSHQENIESSEVIAKKLFDLICEEIRGYIVNGKKIAILLSGGMDSRIVAGSLDYLIKTKQVDIDSVKAYTWGNIDSRDVIYAEKIAKRLNWPWKHYTVSSSDLWENFRIAGLRGCEYSGLHLHAIPQIQKEIKDDILLVASYGDSIGRAEYQGIRVHNLTPISKNFRNFGNLLIQSEYKRIKNLWKEDIDFYHNIYSESKLYQQLELDYQIHYMRRMLNSCMEILNEAVPTYQVFGNPSVYEFMWSLDPSCRNDEVYLHMMNLFSTSLGDIPWARTGLPYGERKGKPDSYLKSHHFYFDFIQFELIDRIESRVLSERVRNLGLFNMEAIKNLIKLIKNSPNHNTDYLESITWLVSLDFYLEEFENVKGEESRNTSFDYIAAYLFTPLRYLLLQLYRRIK